MFGMVNQFQWENKHMEYYRFYDTDLYGNEEYDISGEQYKELIKECCKHSKYMSFIIYDKSVKGYNQLCEYKLGSIDIAPDSKYARKYEILYCNICAGLLNFLLNNVNSIFEWMLGRGFLNPEDPTFYREDGTIFFSSSIHEGIITLRPKGDDVSHIVFNNPLWVHSDNDVRANKMIYKTIDLPCNICTDTEAIELSKSILEDLKTSRKIKEYKFVGLVRYELHCYDVEFHCKKDSKYRADENVIVNIRMIKNKCDVFMASAL